MDKTLKKFEVGYLQILDEKGELDKRLMPRLNNDKIKTMYKNMVLTRVLDDKMLSLQRQGALGTFAQIRGQEAVNIGSAFALGKEDWVVQSFRETGVGIVRGFKMENYLLYYGGDERGNIAPKNVNMLPVAVPVGTQLLHAVGIAFGAKLKNDKIVVAVFFGDGATSEGDFHEAMNFAGVFRLPVIFICQNNQWAISVPRKKQTASYTIAQKAIAYGFNGIQVDGNDMFAVYKAVKEAADNARKGNGSSLIECFTYRMADHTTSDDASRYRSEKEVMSWQKKDPIERVKKFMEKRRIWNQKDEEEWLEKCKKMVEKAVSNAKGIKKPEIEDMFKYMYKEMTDELKEELESLR